MTKNLSHAPSIEGLFKNDHYISYAYAYPHKTTYRFFNKPLELNQVWSKERKNSLFLYFHVPFCEMKCSYCNLFSIPTIDDKLISNYLATIRRHGEIVSDSLENISVATMAIGGGTPTFLSPIALNELFLIASDVYDVNFNSVSISVETSPKTAEKEKLSVLKEYDVDRISIGIQTFIQKELQTLGRSRNLIEIENSLDLIRSYDIPRLNVDLIYGIPGQTVESFIKSIRMALKYSPEEFYLYPLYIRPLTRLEKTFNREKDNRLECYKAARDYLKETGYEQLSMRMFILNKHRKSNTLEYSCQEDGMIGLGCGSRSYTHSLHYSDEYAVKSSKVKNILMNYISRPDQSFRQAHYGIKLSLDDQHRRYVLKSLLKKPGLSLEQYSRWFNNDVFENLPVLYNLIDENLVARERGHLILTEGGLERSDVISYWLYSYHVKDLMEAHVLQ